MDIESVRAYCLSLPHAKEDFPFDETTLAFRVGGRIFAMQDLERTEWFVLKCEPSYALELREQYVEISGAWHMNKRHWNQLNLFGMLSNRLVEHLICYSYNEVVKKIPKRTKAELGLQCVAEEMAQ
jgi:predicted DNA-binding protein (MmcQ/YjbR family)